MEQYTGKSIYKSVAIGPVYFYSRGEQQVKRCKAEDSQAPVSYTHLAICQAVWEDSYYGYENTLMVHIRHLREKIEEDPSHPVWIQTARGLGYRLKKEEGQR